MNWTKLLVSAFLLIVLCVVINACGGGSGVPTADDPTATAVPADTATISDSAIVTLQFSVAMDPTTLVLTGTMTDGSNGGVWSTTTLADDTLTITPTSAWTEGAQTLIIDVESADGASLATLTLNYTVDASLTLKSIEPGNNSFITGIESIVISFNETVDLASLKASGSLWTDGAGVWSASTTTDDTLTISPLTSWAEGAADLTLDIDDLVGNALTQLNLTYTVDLTPPLGTATPENNNTLYTTENIVIGFDESMNPESDVYAGSLVPEIGNLVWSTTTNSSDTITISPSSSWPVGEQTLDVTAADLAGNATTLNLVYAATVIDPCSDGVKNSEETDIDCGGSSCSACADGLVCAAASDCLSNVCTGGICQVPACADGVKNGSETDRDCGGSCSPCGDGAACSLASDCSSHVCTGGVCQIPTCTDSVINGIETDIDCGNGCPACTSGAGCDDNTDCISGICFGGVCQADLDGDGYSVTTGDCNDMNSAVHPGASEACNGTDDDCDGVIDELGAIGSTAWYRDADHDTYGSAADTVTQCSAPVDYVADSSDCDDSVATRHPGAFEFCNGIDDDCDSAVDENFVDLGGVCSAGVGACQSSGTTICASSGLSTICDAVPGLPAVEEVCDSLDNDCDGQTDEASSLTFPLCPQQVGVCAGSRVSVCSAGVWSSCDAADYGPSYEAVEITCDGLDNDCDGDVDENLNSYDDADNCTRHTCSGASGWTVSPLAASTVCRAATGSCDIAEVCDGLAMVCPADEFKISGTACEDGNACTSSDICDGAGACTGGVDRICNDGNACTTDLCDVVTGCVYPYVVSGTSCEDGNLCTVGDYCNGAGACTSGPTTPCDDGNPCTADSCNMSDGLCQTTNVADDTACDDGDPGTSVDKCTAGICAGTL